MGMGSAVKIAIEFKKTGLFDNVKSVMDMGAQELHLKYEDFVYLMDSYGIAFDSSKFENLKNWPGHPRLSTKPFWQALGFQITDCLDLFNQHGSIACDLNLPFENKEYWAKYDLVTDFGNNEHPFNVAEAYRTMHRLCKYQGYMWIDQSVMNGNGYFNFDLAFFEGMAAANSYGVIYSAFVVTTKDGSQCHIPRSRQILELFDFNKVGQLGVNYLFRKNTSEDFRFPIQGIADLDNPYRAYKVAYVDDKFPPERYYIPSTIKLGGRFLVKELAKVLKRKFLSK